MARKTYQRLEVELAMKDAMPPRRSQVFVKAASGMSAAEIAEDLHISVKTVEWHLDEVKGQLCAINIKDAISQGWMHGLLRAKGFVRACALLLALFSSYQIGPARAPRAPRNAKGSEFVRVARHESTRI